MRMNETMRP